MEPEKREAPEWIEVIPIGSIVGRDGRQFTVEDANALLERTAKLEMMLPIDFDHRTDFAPQGSANPAAGWIKALEVREGSIWGQVEWTPLGREAVESLTYRYLSPVITTDKEKNTLQILRAGLTNDPNLKMRAILAREDGGGEKLTLKVDLGGDDGVSKVPFKPDNAPTGDDYGVNADDDDGGGDDGDGGADDMARIQARCHEIMDGRTSPMCYSECHQMLCRFMRASFANADDRKAAWNDLRDHITRKGGRLSKKDDDDQPPAEMRMARKNSRPSFTENRLVGKVSKDIPGENSFDASRTIHRRKDEAGVVSIARHLGVSPFKQLEERGGNYPVHFKGFPRR